MKNKGEKLKEKMQVMLQWKKLYIEALIDELRPFGDVLQVGFGRGYAAERIQSFKPKSLTIIEQDERVIQDIQHWAEKFKNVTILVGSWQTLLPQLGIFDSIFFNDYPIDSDIGVMNRINPEEIQRTSNQAKELLDSMKSQLSQLKMHYSDKEIDEFYHKIGQFNRNELSHFFNKLKEYGFITEKQYEQTLQKYQLEKEADQSTFTRPQDNTFAFLDECLKNHMRKGSRFSCFSNDITSKYEDSQFFENIITNPFLDYRERLIPISVPKFSEYFNFDEGLLMVVEKFSE